MREREKKDFRPFAVSAREGGARGSACFFPMRWEGKDFGGEKRKERADPEFPILISIPVFFLHFILLLWPRVSYLRGRIVSYIILSRYCYYYCGKGSIAGLYLTTLALAGYISAGGGGERW